MTSLSSKHAGLSNKVITFNIIVNCILAFFVVSFGQFSVRKPEYALPTKMNAIFIKGKRKNKFEMYCIQLWKYCCNIDTL